MKKRKYQEVNGTSYHKKTHASVVNNLERLLHSNTRVRIVLGDVSTGESWHEVHDVCGTIGRSMGPIKIPILVHNINSTGGGSILDQCIIGIRHSNRKEGGWIYRNPKYTEDE